MQRARTLMFIFRATETKIQKEYEEELFSGGYEKCSKEEIKTDYVKM